jgi:hypothetical protein
MQKMAMSPLLRLVFMNAAASRGSGSKIRITRLKAHDK